MLVEVDRRGQHDARPGKRLAGSAHHLDAFEHGVERRPLQGVTAGDDRQRQADIPRPLRRKCGAGQSAAERERADRKAGRLSGKRQLACFAGLHPDDRDLRGM